jgi:hypothetical protein
MTALNFVIANSSVGFGVKPGLTVRRPSRSVHLPMRKPRWVCTEETRKKTKRRMKEREETKAEDRMLS